MVFAAVSTVAETGMLWRRTGKPAGEVIVRCREGHLFTTIWIPAVSFKSLRLGLWRVQRCPVGGHWSLVSPVRQSALSEEEALAARERRDIRIP